MELIKQYGPALKLLFELGSILFSAGVLYATVKFHGKALKRHQVEIDGLSTSDREQQQELAEHGRDIEGLKVHTHYPAVH
ncbi:MAG: hypothetical protein ACJ71W_06035 [Terriglobales bacterium]